MLAKKIKMNACFVVTEYCSVSLVYRLASVSCNVTNYKKILLPPNSYILTCTSVMCNLQGLCG